MIIVQENGVWVVIDVWGCKVEGVESTDRAVVEAFVASLEGELCDDACMGLLR